MLGNSRFFWGSGGIFLRNSRILKLEFLRLNLEFPSLTGGSLYGILKFFYGILDFSLGILEFRKSVIPQLDWGISIEILNLFIMRSPDQVGG